MPLQGLSRLTRAPGPFKMAPSLTSRPRAPPTRKGSAQVPPLHRLPPFPASPGPVLRSGV